MSGNGKGESAGGLPIARGTVVRSKVNFIDLAGSERWNKVRVCTPIATLGSPEQTSFFWQAKRTSSLRGRKCP